MYGLIGPPENIPAIAYATTKHAVMGMTKADAISYAREGVRINAICPGYDTKPSCFDLRVLTTGVSQTLATWRRRC
jgi:NAD(P)-dependent dehydrogenase (short-subunit alcohol dehydrogenase family)